MVDFIAYTIVALIGVFGMLGVYLVVRTLRVTSAAERAARGPQPRRSLVRRYRDYVGVADDRNALLNPPLRVLVEFVLALCGFPGIGWMASGHLATGLLLIAVVPSIVWAVAPVALTASGALMQDAFVTVRFLPVLAACSAMALAIAEGRRAWARRSA